MTALLACAAISVVVFGVMFYFLIYNRKSKGNKATFFHKNLSAEIIWAIIPCIILVALALPAIKVLINHGFQ